MLALFHKYEAEGTLIFTSGSLCLTRKICKFSTHMMILIATMYLQFIDGQMRHVPRYDVRPQWESFIQEMQNMHILRDGWRERHLILKALLLAYFHWKREGGYRKHYSSILRRRMAAGSRLMIGFISKIGRFILCDCIEL